MKRSEGEVDKGIKVDQDGHSTPSQGNDPKVDLPGFGKMEIVGQVDLGAELIPFLQLEDPSQVDGFIPGLGLSPLWGLPLARALDGREEADLSGVRDGKAADGVGEEQVGWRAALALEEDLGVDEVQPVRGHNQLVVCQSHAIGQESVGNLALPLQLPHSLLVCWREGGEVSQCEPVSSTLHILALKFCPPPTSCFCPLSLSPQIPSGLEALLYLQGLCCFSTLPLQSGSSSHPAAEVCLPSAGAQPPNPILPQPTCFFIPWTHPQNSYLQHGQQACHLGFEKIILRREEERKR